VFHRQPAAHVTPAAQRPASLGPAREVFRLVPPVVLWWVWLAFAAANVADFAVQGASARFVTVVCAILATVTGFAYALALHPRVIAEPAGLVIVNPFRDHHVPWGAIQTVDTGDWVRVHYASDEGAPSSAAGKSISCWALYISARVKRKAAIPPRMRGSSPPPFYRYQMLSRRASLPGEVEKQPGYAGDSRLPEEAKYLASLPVAKAIAARLDTRAAKERARGSSVGPVTARWAWLPLAAVAVPALALLIIALL
jgi:Bacterial PH domain